MARSGNTENFTTPPLGSLDNNSKRGIDSTVHYTYIHGEQAALRHEPPGRRKEKYSPPPLLVVSVLGRREHDQKGGFFATRRDFCANSGRELCCFFSGAKAVIFFSRLSYIPSAVCLLSGPTASKPCCPPCFSFTAHLLWLPQDANPQDESWHNTTIKTNQLYQQCWSNSNHQGP